MSTNIITKAVVWDFDGVLVAHSETFKEDAWRIMLEDYPGAVALHRDASSQYGFGKPGDRFDILRHIFTGLGYEGAVLERTVAREAERFNTLVQERIAEAGVVEGACSLLEAIRARGVAQYVNSGTAQVALRQSLDRLELMPYFKDAYGGPASKGDNLKAILARESAKPDEVVLLGDSIGDVRGARETGVRLIGLCNAWNGWKGTVQPFPLVTSFSEVLDLL